MNALHVCTFDMAAVLFYRLRNVISLIKMLKGKDDEYRIVCVQPYGIPSYTEKLLLRFNKAAVGAVALLCNMLMAV